MKPYLTTRSLLPENQESPIELLQEWQTEDSLFYLRNHFPYPQLSQHSFDLPIFGHIPQPKVFTYKEIQAMPSKTLTVLLECAGNKRSYFEPKVYGEQWEQGAISQGTWKGVPLAYLLSITGLLSSAKEVVFEGSDYGTRTDMEGVFYYGRSLPLDKALHPDTIIAYEFNGKPIPYKHGYPYRLIVPQWYAMASVKWLKRIMIIDHAYRGPFQSIDYQYYPDPEGDEGKQPVTTMNVNSIIQKPLPYEVLNQGVHEITGIAWSGKGRVVEVDVSVDGGKSWNRAKPVFSSAQSYTWTLWSYTWEVHDAGEYVIWSRARDTEGRIQPQQPFWNRKGYGYHAIPKVNVKVE
ncbi:sulfite oxidase [Ammoniphilus sp. YIM 78166]|uniref:sulfite oxidase n=1 Tax=Ammoniphilus sp. YIM 78166 TaxID=1644106 RepID=UPI001F0DC0E6|nr:sulfite oxidase [Ammoniphilus sp. YIM 78166]